MDNKNNQKENKDINNYQKRGFIRNLPFGVKATFIKYWFYGALYFFCFMGLGLFLKNETLIIVTGLIGGVLFDIAVYNIFLLFADTREEASKWWFFKSKKVYSIFINIAVIIGMMFAFYFIVVPIRMAIGYTWFLAEPLSCALVLIILDTAICWIKNLIIMLIKKIFKIDSKTLAAKDSLIKIIDVTPVSVTIQINNKGNFFSLAPFNVLLDNQIIFKKIKNNILTIYDLKPDTQYKITINRQNKIFTTSKISRFYKVYEGNDINKVLDNADQYSLIVVNKGTYNIKPLSFKNNVVFYLRKGAILNASNDINDYQILPSYHPMNKNEVYGNLNGEAKQIRQGLINLDHISNVKIVGEGIIDASSISFSNNSKSVVSPYLVFINHSDKISISGITFKSSNHTIINSFFSDDINLLNLNIINSNINNGIIIQCSSNINVIGSNFSKCNDAILIESGTVDFAKSYNYASKDILIDNCLIESSNNSVIIGHNISSGINNINISNCCFNNSNYGINIISNSNQYNEAIVKDVNVISIDMNNVITPIAMNMYDCNKISSLTNSKAIRNEFKLPQFNNFVFKNIIAKNYELCAGCFYGLNEKFIGEINIIDSMFTAKSECKEGYPINILDNKNKCSKNGFLINNVKTFIFDKVSVTNQVGKKFVAENVNEVIDK